MSATATKIDRLSPERLRTNPRASMSAWLKYKDIIVAAYRQHPNPYVYKPINMSPESVVSKARDAVRGKLAFDYPCEEVSNVDLMKWYSEVIFKCDDENVYIGEPERVQSVLRGTVSVCDSTLKFSSLEFEEVAAFCLLLSHGRLVGPILVQQPPDMSLLQPRPNVELISRDDGSLVLL